MKKFDAVIIGTGQAGVPLAKALADKNWKVAVLEDNLLGGSCVNYGCTPTKAMVASARRVYVARHSQDHGITTGAVRINLPAIVKRKDQIVADFRGSVQRRLTHKNITLYRETGSFIDTYKVAAGSEVIEGKYLFLNTGQRPVIPPIPGLKDTPFLTSTEILDLKRLPEHLLVLGGGYVGLEFAQMFRRFGSAVTIIQRSDKLASNEDPDISAEIKNILQAEGIKIMFNTEVLAVKKTGSQISLEIKKGGRVQNLIGSHLLVAVGRQPNTDKLNLKKAGISFDKRGFIKTNRKLQTNVKNIYALGDIKGGPAFTHISYDDYVIVYKNLFEGGKLTTADRVLVYAIFIDPSLGRVGLIETEAREQGFQVAVAEYPLSWVARAIELGETQGKMKLVVDKKTERILGAAILGYEGAELIHVLAAYMNARASYKVVQKAIATHPTLAEGIQSLALALT